MDRTTVHIRRIVERSAVVTVVMDRPPLNVLDLRMMRELREAVTEVAHDPAVTVLQLRGHGRAFCAGVDVADHTQDRVHSMMSELGALLQALRGAPCAVVAVVEGAALGGGFELLQACDISLVKAGVKLGQPELRLGVFPPAAAVYLPRLVGRQKAMDVILSARTFRAQEALEMGLVSKVIPEADFDAEVEAYIDRLAHLSAPVLRLTKRVVEECASLPENEAMLHAEACYLKDLMALDDAHEGLQAFLENREPTWTKAGV